MRVRQEVQKVLFNKKIEVTSLVLSQNPYVKYLKQPVTMRLDRDTVFRQDQQDLRDSLFQETSTKQVVPGPRVINTKTV